MTKSVISCCFVMFLALPVVATAQSRNPTELRGSLSGRVLLEGDHSPASQIRVELRLLSGSWSRSAITDRDGDFHIDGIPEGTCLVAVNVPGYAPFEQSMQVDYGTAPLMVRLRRNSPPQANSTAAMVSARELHIPEKARKFLEKGNQLFAKDPVASISEYQRAIKAFSDFYEAYYAMGVAELNQEHHAEAEAAFRKAVETSEGRYAPALSGLSLALCVERRFAEAEAVAHEDLELDPSDASGHYALALVSFASGHLPDAEKEVVEAIRYRPRLTQAFLLLAEIHQRQNNPAAVVADLDAYLQLDANNPKAAKVRTARAAAQSTLLQQVAGSSLARANP
jgi:tetratricopeptide (TPR) repeat protein